MTGKPLTITDCQRVLGNTPQFHRITALLKQPKTGDIGGGALLALLIADFMKRTLPFDDVAIYLLVEAAVKEIGECGEIIKTLYDHRDPEAEVPQLNMVWSDHKYATWSGSTDWLDMLTGERLALLPEPPVFNTSLHLPGCYFRFMNTIRAPLK